MPSSDGLEFKSATTSQRIYIYRKCPYIKVDVKLAISSPYEDLPSDKITEISRPVRHLLGITHMLSVLTVIGENNIRIL